MSTMEPGLDLHEWETEHEEAFADDPADAAQRDELERRTVPPATSPTASNAATTSIPATSAAPSRTSGSSAARSFG